METTSLQAAKLAEMTPGERSTDDGLPPQLVHITTVSASMWGFFRGQIAFMKSRGFDVRGISSPGPLLEAFGQCEHIPVEGITMTRTIDPMRDSIGLAQLWRQIRRWRPAIIHAHTPKAGLLGMLAAWAACVPVRIYHLRGLPLETTSGWKRRLLWTTEWLACRLAHRVLCISESLRQQAIQLRFCPADKIQVLCNGSGNGVDAISRFDPSRFDRNSARSKLGIPLASLVVGFVGRMARDKGIVDLARSWEMLSASRSELRWLIVGDLDTRDPIHRELYCRLQNDPRVHILGFVADVTEWYAAMDVCVLPTYREGFGNVLLEAAAMRLPVVATRVTGCVDAVADGVTGTLVPPRDARELAHAIARYLDDPALRRDHGEAGRKRVLRDFHPEHLWTELHHEYEVLLRRRGIAIPATSTTDEARKAA